MTIHSLLKCCNHKLLYWWQFELHYPIFFIIFLHQQLSKYFTLGNCSRRGSRDNTKNTTNITWLLATKSKLICHWHKIQPRIHSPHNEMPPGEQVFSWLKLFNKCRHHPQVLRNIFTTLQSHSIWIIYDKLQCVSALWKSFIVNQGLQYIHHKSHSTATRQYKREFWLTCQHPQVILVSSVVSAGEYLNVANLQVKLQQLVPLQSTYGKIHQHLP